MKVGGFEIGAMAGAILGAAAKRSNTVNLYHTSYSRS